MSLDNTTMIDAIGIEKNTGDLVLTIADASDWADAAWHIQALREKFLNYLGFIESGDIQKYYPGVGKRRVIIDLISRFPVPEIGQSLLNRLEIAASRTDVILRRKYFKG